MKILEVGNPALYRKAQPVESYDEVGRLIPEMIKSMNEANGVGLAATQLGVDKAVVIYVHPYKKRLIVMINPEISVADSRIYGCWEGCLSVPQARGYVERPKKITVRFKDERWRDCRIIASNFHSSLIQHEVDHLNGILFIDRASLIQTR